MKFKFNPRTGGMTPEKDPSREILDAVRRDASIERGHAFQSCTLIRESLAMCTEPDGNTYCVVRLNGQWRCIGRVVNMAAIRKASYGPLVNFHLAWQSGVQVTDPRESDE